MHELNDELIRNVIITLKGIDARGFDSMDRLVGLVGLFENILNQPPVNAENEET